LAQNIASIKGMNDILPDQTSYWRYVERLLIRWAQNYGYREIRFPILEQTALFARSIGEVTDIVEKEMYTFTDRNGYSLTLRPEGTAGCVRAAIEHGLIQNQQQQRFWYLGPLFRHERPQQARYRQFHQFGVEAFGFPGSDIEAEQIILIARLWRELGLSNHIKLQLNSLGSFDVRQRYCERLVEYFKPYYQDLDADSQRRLTTNPLRILDSKNQTMQPLIQNAPKLIDVMDERSKAHFDALCDYLEQAGVDYEINPYIVRGLDYYCDTVFEWVSTELGAQGTVCAGGRYDNLVSQIGGQPTPAVGFAIGLERLVALLQNRVHIKEDADVYVIMVGEQAKKRGIQITEKLRDQLPQWKIVNHCGEGSFKSQFKKANKSGARWAVIVGDEELRQNRVSLKDLREDQPQKMLQPKELEDYLKQHELSGGETHGQSVN